MCLTFWGGEAVSRMRIRLNALVTLSHGKGFTLYPFIAYHSASCIVLIILLSLRQLAFSWLHFVLHLTWSDRGINKYFWQTSSTDYDFIYSSLEAQLAFASTASELVVYCSLVIKLLKLSQFCLARRGRNYSCIFQRNRVKSQLSLTGRVLARKYWRSYCPVTFISTAFPFNLKKVRLKCRISSGLESYKQKN